MNDRAFFKLALLEKLAELGYTLDQVKSQVKTAVAQLEKQSLGEGMGALGMLGLAAIPPLAGAGIGYAAAHALNPDDTTPKNIKTQELIEQYRQLTQKAKINNLLKQRKLGERPSFSRI